MIIPFSERHKKLLENNDFELEFTEKQRRKIFYFINDYSGLIDIVTETNFHYTESTFNFIYRDLLKAYGLKKLGAEGIGFKEKEEVENFILQAKGFLVLDVIELFVPYVDEEKKIQFEYNLNKLLKFEECPVRFINSEFLRVDSAFLESEILYKTGKLLSNHRFETAHIDFLDARRRLSTGDYTGCIISANNSLESYLKKLLDKRKDNQGKLKTILIKSGLIPDYFQGFINSFDGLLQSAFTIANKTVRHGRIEEHDHENKIDEPVASFCLNLVGTLILFITDRQIEFNKIGKIEENKIGENISESIEDDLPF